MSFIKNLLSKPPIEYSEEDRSNLNPMDKAKKDWDRRVGSVLVQNYNLRRICILLCFVILVETGGLVKNVGLVQEQKYDIKDAQIKYFLGQFIKNIRELPLDIVIYKQNINTAYAFMTKDAANKMNSILSADENLTQNIGKKTVLTKINTILPISGSENSWQIRWTEETYTLGSNKKNVANMSAIVTIAIKAPKDEATLTINPLGIYIKDFSWDKEASKEIQNQSK